MGDDIRSERTGTDVKNSGIAHTNSGRYAHNPKTIRALIKQCGLTNAALARKINVHQSTVSSWTTGRTESPGAVIAYLELRAKLRALAP